MILCNKDTSEPIDFASVTLVDKETGAFTRLGTMTDENGNFMIKNAPSGKYIIKISNLGSITQEHDITVGETDVDMGIIAMSDDVKLLREVTVVGQKSQMSVNSEHRIFNVSSNIASAGASAEELLASVPSVHVDSDGEISLRGNADVLVWIDGKEMGMNADNRAQFLRQIPAETIESIEVMTNPSSKNNATGTAGIINIRLKEEHRNGYFGSAETDIDTQGSMNANFSINYNRGKFESFAGVGLKSRHNPGGTVSRRSYDNGGFLNSDGENKKHENSAFVRLGTNFKPDESNTFYLSAIGTIGHKWGHTETTHLGNLPELWTKNTNSMHESGDTRGANVLLGYRHMFRKDHFVDMNVSYNIWQGPNDNRSHERATWADGSENIVWQSQHQDIKISNWEVAADYSNSLAPWMRLEAGYKGNYNHENSPASYYSGTAEDNLAFMPGLYNRFKYDTDISALYVNLSGQHGQLTFSAGLRGELWQTRTHSLKYGENDADVPSFRKNDFALFPSASV